mgnify:CR=1 FL=1
MDIDTIGTASGSGFIGGLIVAILAALGLKEKIKEIAKTCVYRPEFEIHVRSQEIQHSEVMNSIRDLTHKIDNWLVNERRITPREQ